ncbi:MAG: acetate kinase [bacterium]|nr:acetate kinase [bacterium]
MKILALNCGSSSVKYQLFDWDKMIVIAKGIIERIGIGESFIVHQTPQNNGKFKQEHECPDHEAAIHLIIKTLTNGDTSVLKNIQEISAVGHRVVHGGEKFTHSELINDDVIKTIEEVSDLAPLHNPANLTGIRAAQHTLPNSPHIAVFDTAFHQSMPKHAYLYPLPYDWYKDHSIRRYGFHGTSHLYVSKRAAALLGKDANKCNIITLHIGNGVSCCAVKNGKSIDTSMGLTPLEGAVMGTRCGDIDPAIPLFMQEKLNISTQDMNNILNKKSGVLGITRKFADRRDIEDGAKEGDSKCSLAIDIESYRLRKYIGAYTAVLGRVDAIVFTAGVGENGPIIRKKTLQDLEDIGIVIDYDINGKTYSKNGETELSKPESKIKVFMIPTNEELVFVEDVVAILQNKYEDHTQYKYSFLK